MIPRRVLVVLVAALAMGAVATSVASATTIKPLNTKFIETAHGATSSPSFEFPSGAKVECETATAEGTTPAKENEGGPIPVAVKFHECFAFGGKFTVVAKCAVGKSFSTTLVSGSPIKSELLMPSGCELVIKTLECTFSMSGSQSINGTWTNEKFPKLSLDTIRNAPIEGIVSPAHSICGPSGALLLSATFTTETENKLSTLTVTG
jgi:hypothetical protein